MLYYIFYDSTKGLLDIYRIIPAQISGLLAVLAVEENKIKKSDLNFLKKDLTWFFHWNIRRT